MRRGMERAVRTAGFGAKGFAAVAVLALFLAGCAGDAQPLLTQAQLRGPSIAFESIDGPPLPIFQKLVADLSAEAEQRRILVVSRAGQPAYRVRGYLAALMSHGKTHIGWVWDVYDAEKHRAFRIAGEEVFSGKSADAWALLDDAMLARIARTSMDRLVAFLATPDTAVAGLPPPTLPAAFAGMPPPPAIPAAFAQE
jgi:hypothetical protein